MFSVITLTALIVCCQTAPPTAAPVDTGRGRKKMIERKLKEENIVPGVTLKASIAEGRAGESMEMTYVLSNDSDRTVYWGRLSGYNDCEIEVFDENNRPAPRTSAGEHVQNSFNPFGVYELLSIGIRPLAPGESKTWNIDLNWLFDLAPGDYTVKVRTLVNRRTGAFSAATGPVKFRVASSEPPHAADGPP